MKSIVSTLIAIGIIAPYGSVYAEVYVSNSGTVVSETSASANTGGQHASSGQTITTGDASASASVETRVNGIDGGAVKIKVATP